MAGDKVDIATRAWVPYAASAPDEQPIEPVSLFSSLLNALSNGAAGLSGGHTTLGVLQSTGSSMPPGITSFLNNHNDVVLPAPPKAYLNWILFDEQFRYVPEGSGFIRVGYYDDGRLQTLAQSGLPIVKNGYLFVYLSNESKKPVFFDNLVVQHYPGPLIEETQYYPFGLSMSGISGKAMGRLENKNRYNGGNELQSTEFGSDGLELYDAVNRMYDPQVGRFRQVDELAESNWEM